MSNKLQDKVARLRERQIDAYAALLASVEETIRSFNETNSGGPIWKRPPQIDPKYTEYAETVRSYLDKAKSRVGSEVVWIDEVKTIKEMEMKGIPL